MTIRLFLCDIRSGDECHLARLLARLTDDERARAARFVFDSDRLSFAAAHALLRFALDRTARQSRPWRFATGAFGKPRLDPPYEDIRFNLSHARGLVAAATLRGGEVGVDVESVTATIDEATFSTLVLAPSEVADLDRVDDRAARFRSLWVAKEAIVKALGTGLSLPLRRIVLGGDPLAIVALPDRYGQSTDWCLQVEHHAAHWLALAHPGPGLPIERVILSIAQLADTTTHP